MDLKLLARGVRPRRNPLPWLWLFTDEARLPDPRSSVRSLPRGKAGVVLRHDRDPGRASLGRDLALICRQRRLQLVVAGDVRLAATLRAGVHLRAGRWPKPNRVRLRPGQIVTSSAHSIPDLLRARRAGANLAFLSPAFHTASHAGAPGLGAVRWVSMARSAATSQLRIGALGGVNGESVRRLPSRFCDSVGAIEALSVKD